jgi:hypothetical protein
MGSSNPIEFPLIDIEALTDSISLVCSADAKFCGDKELVLLDPKGSPLNLSIIKEQLFSFDSANSMLTI